MSGMLCYASYDQKRADYPGVVIPRLVELAFKAAKRKPVELRTWLAGFGLDLDRSGATVRELSLLHHAARGGRYRVNYPLHCERFQPVETTLAEGGDCDQWAVVLMAVLFAWGVPVTFVGAGDDLDPFQHVYVRAYANGWYTLDPKPDQRGEEFDQTTFAQTTVLFPLEVTA